MFPYKNKISHRLRSAKMRKGLTYRPPTPKPSSFRRVFATDTTVKGFLIVPFQLLAHLWQCLAYFCSASVMKLSQLKSNYCEVALDSDNTVRAKLGGRWEGVGVQRLGFLTLLRTSHRCFHPFISQFTHLVRSGSPVNF